MSAFANGQETGEMKRMRERQECIEFKKNRLCGISQISKTHTYQNTPTPINEAKMAVGLK